MAFDPSAAIAKYIFGDSSANVITGANFGNKFDPNGARPGGFAAPLPKANPNGVQKEAQNSTPSGQYTGNYGGSGNGQSAALYDDQINQVNGALGRIGNQRNIGYSNINSQVNSALNNLLGQNAVAERDYATNKQRTIDDNVNARAKVDENVARQSAGLRKLLGNSSSAAEFAAPLAVAKQGNGQLGDIQTAYGRNIQNLDTADEDRKRQFQTNQSDIQNQAQIQRNQLEAGLAQNEASLLDQLSQLQVNRAEAKGQSYDAARSLTQANNNRVNSLLAQIDQLGLNPNIAARGDVRFNAPDLSQYNTSDINIAQGASPLQSAAGQFLGLLSPDDRRRQQL